MPGPILLCGINSSLLKMRAEVLRNAGFDILQAPRLDHVEEIAATTPIIIMVLCHTLPLDDQEKAIATLVRHRPHAKVIVLTTNFTQETPAKPIILVSASEGPDSLIKTLGKLTLNLP